METKICPFAATHIRAGELEQTTTLDIECIGKKCMAWRVSPEDTYTGYTISQWDWLSVKYPECRKFSLDLRKQAFDDGIGNDVPRELSGTCARLKS